MIKSYISKRNFKKGQNYFAENDYINAAEYFRKAAEDGHADAQFNLGIMYVNGLGVQKNNEDALRWLGKAAGQGHAEAKNKLGLLRGGKGKIEKGKKQVESPEEQDALGHAYLHGEGVEQNYEEAVKWFRKAADQGYPPAQFNLGMRYRDGSGVEKNLREGFRWIRKAMEQGLAIPAAQSILGQAYFFGEGTEQNFHKAVEWLTKASIVVISEKQERIDVESFTIDADAQFYLGWCYLTGNGITKNVEEAKLCFYSAAQLSQDEALKTIEYIKQNKCSLENISIHIRRIHNGLGDNFSSCIGGGIELTTRTLGKPEYSKVNLVEGVGVNLHEKYVQGKLYLFGNEEEKNENEGAKLIIEVSDYGYAPALYIYSCLLEEGIGVEKNLIESLKLLKKAAELGDPNAQHRIGNLYESGEYGEVLPKDHKEAMNWYKKSAEQGNHMGQYHYGAMLFDGYGVMGKNEKEGLKWIRLAAEQGHEAAIDFLSRISNSKCDDTDKDEKLTLKDLKDGEDAFEIILSKDEEVERKFNVGEGNISDKKEFLILFWKSLLRLAEARTNLHANVKPSERTYIVARIKRCLEFNYQVLNKEARVDLYINSGDKGKNKAIYDSLYTQKTLVQHAFEGELKWERLDDKDACRISKLLDVGSYKDKEKWPEIQKSMIDAMVRLEKALMPYITELDI